MVSRRCQNKPVDRLVFWNKPQGSRSQGRPRLTYPKLLSQDTGIPPTRRLTQSHDEGQGAVEEIHHGFRPRPTK